MHIIVQPGIEYLWCNTPHDALEEANQHDVDLNNNKQYQDVYSLLYIQINSPSTRKKNVMPPTKNITNAGTRNAHPLIKYKG